MSAAIKYAKNLTPGIGRLADIVIVSGKGSYVFTDKNEKYLDFASGIGVVSTGHCHPKVVKAIQDQAGKMIHAQVNVLNLKLIAGDAVRSSTTCDDASFARRKHDSSLLLPLCTVEGRTSNLSPKF